MALVPALDLRPRTAANDPLPAPANIEAEQALLGTLMWDNGALERIGTSLSPEDFFEPFHQRLFAAIQTSILKGHLAEPILLTERFQRDEAFQDLGGVQYLALLVDRAPPAANAPDYARAIRDTAMRRNLLRVAGEIAHAATDPDDDRPAADHVEAAEAQLYTLAETRGSTGGLRAFSEALSGAVAMAAEAYQRDGGLSGISTGLIDLDQKLGGMHPSDLIILAARPSMGKSALAVNIAYHVAKNYQYDPQPDGTRKTVNGGQVAFFQLEMSEEQLALRILSEVAGVSGDKIRKGDIDATEFGRIRDAAMEIAEIPLKIDATGAISVGRIAARARRMKRQGGLDLIIVDYLQLATGDKRYAGGERVQEVSEITQALKALAKELNVPVLALAQLSRQVETRADKKPQLSDLRESGSIEQDADMVMFIYREAYYLSREEPRENTPEHLTWQEKMDNCRGLAEVIIGKQRHGPIGVVRLAFNEDLTKFGNLARDWMRRGAPVEGTLPYGSRDD